MLAFILIIAMIGLVYYVQIPLLSVLGIILLFAMLLLLLLALVIKQIQAGRLKMLALIFSFIAFAFLILFGFDRVLNLSRSVLCEVLSFIVGVLTIAAVFINTYSLNLVINLRKHNLEEIDYLIVLGAGLKGTKVQPLLASRINKAVEIYRKNSQLTLIMSGGQGPDEAIAEGMAMADFAHQQGVPMDSILIEPKSTNTHENLLFSMQLVPETYKKVGIVTTHYHTLRALIIAKELEIRAVAYGSPASKNWIFVMNAFSRELMAYLFRRINWVLIIVVLYIIYSLFINFDLIVEILKLI